MEILLITRHFFLEREILIFKAAHSQKYILKGLPTYRYHGCDPQSLTDQLLKR